MEILLGGGVVLEAKTKGIRPEACTFSSLVVVKSASRQRPRADASESMTAAFLAAASSGFSRGLKETRTAIILPRLQRRIQRADAVSSRPLIVSPQSMGHS